jgi:tRNA 2-thiouridine synthesizing protein A
MDEIKTINACGLSCPQPAVLTREALGSMVRGTVEVLVDTTGARDNVSRTAHRAGWKVSIESQSDGSFRLILKK